MITLGTKLGRYEVRSKIGEGGMGEVYRAFDPKLNRTVAIKVLPGALSADSNRLSRFEQEAQAIGALNHPNILAVYDVGTHANSPYVVSELLRGQPLRERLANGPIPQRQAIDFALQIAGGLMAAHERGIVHRDLKPDNIFVTEDDRVKILDFGLAKLIDRFVDGLGQSDVPTRRLMTDSGVVMGTVGYMSPEQVRGQTLDHRSDIFAFGAVLYEMLSGQRAFQRGSDVETLNAILKEEPGELSEANNSFSRPVDRIVRHCLEKNPDRRFQSAGDIAFALENLSTTSTRSPPQQIQSSPGLRWRLHWLIAGALLVALAGGVAGWLLSRAPHSVATPLTRFALTLPASTPLATSQRPAVAFSPDGTRLVYVAGVGGSTQLYLRQMDQFESTPIPGTEGGSGPFFSPDGQWLGFFTYNKLKKVSLKGGAPLILCNASPVSRGASWGPDDTILFIQAHSEGISRISASGGNPQIVTTPNAQQGEVGHYWPEILPGGKHVLFTIATAGNFDEAYIAVQSLETGARQALVRGGSHAHYVPTGHLVYVRAGSLMAVPFDLGRLKVAGTPVPVIDKVMVARESGAGHFSFSSSGSLVYASGDAAVTERSLLWVDRRGATRALSDIQRQFHNPSLSPEGQRVAVMIYGTNQDVWIYEFTRGTLTRLTFDGSEDWGPIWTPDGKRVAFTSVKPGAFPNVFWKPADGTGTEEQLTTGNNPKFTGSWSPDGKTLAFSAFGSEGDTSTGNDILVLSLEGDYQPRPFLRTTFSEYGPEFSPDGHWLAYVSNESGRNEVYVQPFPGPGAKQQISTEGGTSPVWARNGRELFYRHDDKMMAVGISLQPEFTAATPRFLFAGKYDEAGLPDEPRNYDVTPDGQRFVMVKASEQPAVPSQLNIVVGWFAELKSRVPVTKQ